MLQQMSTSVRLSTRVMQLEEGSWTLQECSRSKTKEHKIIQKPHKRVYLNIHIMSVNLPPQPLSMRDVPLSCLSEQINLVLDSYLCD